MFLWIYINIYAIFLGVMFANDFWEYKNAQLVDGIFLPWYMNFVPGICMLIVSIGVWGLIKITAKEIKK